MAGDRDKIVVGAHATFSIGAYVTAKGAGSLTDVGFTGDGVSFKATVEHKMVEVDQHLAPIRAVPIKREYELKIRLLETQMEHLRVLLGQPAANLTGIFPDETLVVDDDAAEQYHQIALVDTGLGTTKVRTSTFWRAFVKDLAEIPIKKDEMKFLEATFGILKETTGTGSDDIAKIVET